VPLRVAGEMVRVRAKKKHHTQTRMLNKFVSANSRYKAYKKRGVWRFLEKHNGKTRFIPKTQTYRRGDPKTLKKRAHKKRLQEQGVWEPEKKEKRDPEIDHHGIMTMKFFELNPTRKRGKTQKSMRNKHKELKKKDQTRQQRWKNKHKKLNQIRKGVVIHPKLRKTLTPGTVCIILAGHYQSKKCIFLKQLYNGLLLVTGPYYCNGVPLRRVAQCYVIATQTKVDISGIDLKKYNNRYFLSKAVKVDKKNGADFFEEQKKRRQTPSAEQKALQKALDKQICRRLKAVPYMFKYMCCRFKLRKNQFPHKMTF